MATLKREHSLHRHSPLAADAFLSTRRPSSRLPLPLIPFSNETEEVERGLKTGPPRTSSRSSVAPSLHSGAPSSVAESTGSLVCLHPSPLFHDEDNGDEPHQPTNPTMPTRYDEADEQEPEASITSSFLPLTAEEESEEEKQRAFLQWLQRGGAKFPHLTLRRYARDYRGVHIRCQEGQEIHKGKCLLRIPHTMLITVELAKQSAWGKVVASLSTIGSQAILALYLLQERAKGSASFWQPWLSVLPSAFSSLPMFFSSQELAELNCCPELLSKISSQQKSMRDEFAAIGKAFRAQNQSLPFTLDDFVWAALSVGTRVFSLCINNVKTSVLAPLADMMNHRNPSPASWTFDNKKDAFTLTACASMRDGEPVYESYGVKDNKRFFASYGFCLLENPANEVSLHIQNKHLGEQWASRTFLIKRCYDSSFEEILSYLRMINALESTLGLLGINNSRPTNPLSALSQAIVTQEQFTQGISVDSELSSLYALRCAVKEHLRMHTTTLEEDECMLKNLADEEQNNNKRNILIFRIGEKSLYSWIHDFVSTAISLFCLPCSNLMELLGIKKWEAGSDAILHDDGDGDGSGDGSHETHVLQSMMPYITNIVLPLMYKHNTFASSADASDLLTLSSGSASRRFSSTDNNASPLNCSSLYAANKISLPPVNTCTHPTNRLMEHSNSFDCTHSALPSKTVLSSASQSCRASTGSARISSRGSFNRLPSVNLNPLQMHAPSTQDTLNPLSVCSTKARTSIHPSFNFTSNHRDNTASSSSTLTNPTLTRPLQSPLLLPELALPDKRASSHLPQRKNVYAISPAPSTSSDTSDDLASPFSSYMDEED